MGSSSSRLPRSKKEFVVMMVGLNGAGKTSIVNRLKDPKALGLPPSFDTIGEERQAALFAAWAPAVDHISMLITIWDAGGKQKIRPLWRQYYHHGDGFIFVVSAVDSGRLLEARQELHQMCKDRDIWKCPLLVLVNKSDHMGNGLPNPHAAPVEFVSAALDIATSGFRVWDIQAVSALTGEGLADAFKWMSDRVTARPNSQGVARY